MRDFIVLQDYSATQYTLAMVSVWEGWVTTFDTFLGGALTAIELATSIFEVDADLLSFLNPVLPLEFDSGIFWHRSTAVAVQPFTGVGRLKSWQGSALTLGLDVPLAEEYLTPHIVCQWLYVLDYDYPTEAIFDYPNDQGIVRDTVSFSPSTLTAFGYNPDLYRQLQSPPAPGSENAVLPDLSLPFHYLGGALDLSQYSVSFVPSSETAFNLVATESLPAGVDYKGTNVWNISDEFSDRIGINSGSIGDSYYYRLHFRDAGLEPFRTYTFQPPPVDYVHSAPFVTHALALLLLASQMLQQPDVIRWMIQQFRLGARLNDYLLVNGDYLQVNGDRLRV